MPDEAKTFFKKIYINWSRDAQITSFILAPQKCHQNNQWIFDAAKFCDKFRG